MKLGLSLQEELELQKDILRKFLVTRDEDSGLYFEMRLRHILIEISRIRHQIEIETLRQGAIDATNKKSS